MMVAAKIIDYIVVREPCHLHYHDHNAAFWNEVDKLMLEYGKKGVVARLPEES